jgi:hypothetical protein
MSTRANIHFSDDYDNFYVDSSHDGFPENILPDIEKTIHLCKNRWSGSELGQLVSAFLGLHFNENTRIQNYEPCSGKAGDESYCYFVKWNNLTDEYDFGVFE